MKLVGSNSSIIINLIISLAIGIILGNFIGDKVYPITTTNAFSNNVDLNDVVFYVLVLERFDDENDALNYADTLKQDVTFVSYFKDNEKYVVFADVDVTSSNLLKIKNDLLSAGYLAEVVEYNLTETTLTNHEDGLEQYFWLTSIQYYIDTMDNNLSEIHSDYIKDVDENKLTFYNYLVSYRSNIDNIVLSAKLKLLSFKYLYEGINQN